MRDEEKIVFTSMDELSKYNEKLLSEFVSYLNDKHKQNHNVFHCGAKVSIVSDDKLIKEFLNSVSLEERYEKSCELIDKNEIDFYCSYGGDCMASNDKCKSCSNYVCSYEDM